MHTMTQSTQHMRHILLGLTRIAMGWIFLWGFLDKVFGLGYTTAADKSWLDGVSPTAGFLKFATTGPLSSVYQAMAGNVFVDWLFMLGLLLLGLSLIFGVGTRIAGYAGALMMLLMWSAALPPEHNPVIDEHIVYLLFLLFVATSSVGQWVGLGAWWSKTGMVKKCPWLL